MRDQFLFSLRKINYMKYFVVLFCLISSMSFAQKTIFSLKAPLNLSPNKNLVDENPSFSFSSEDFSALILFMQKNNLDNLPIDLIVGAEGAIEVINISNMPDLQSFIKNTNEDFNLLLNKFIGKQIIETPALLNKKPVGFSTTVVLFQMNNSITLNPILHD
jgi:hypothetical protein